jgi:hypothetical protein
MGSAVTVGTTVSVGAGSAVAVGTTVSVAGAVALGWEVGVLAADGCDATGEPHAANMLAISNPATILVLLANCLLVFIYEPHDLERLILIKPVDDGHLTTGRAS